MKKKKMHILSHTHWDREWYQPFQHYRMRLVYQIDMLLETLENDPLYRCFHLDGQTCCVEDYLAIRPQNRQRLQVQLEAGRILIGPWFVMPDEFLVSGESIVRNLRLGHKMCEDLGVQPMPIGYVTDVFGHVSQLPQIMNGFGINSVFLHRGAPSDEFEKSELLWDGADNTRVLVIKAYRDTGYNDFLSIHLYNRGNTEYISQYEQKKISYSNTDVLFALDGNDHTPAFNDVNKLIAECNDVFEQSECFHSSMTDFLNALNLELTPEKKACLSVVKGELRTPPQFGEWNEVFFGTGSARYDLKQQNDICEYLLTRSAEPLGAWARLYGGDDNSDLLSCAWNYLLKNHPHDSIVGCSMDQIHKDMIYRFDQCRLIAQACSEEAIRTIGQKICVKEGLQYITLFNLSTARQEAGEILLELPLGKGSEYESKNATVSLTDPDGVKSSARISRVEKCKQSPYFMEKTRSCDTNLYQIDFDRCHGTDHVYLDAQFDLSPMSFKTFCVEFVTDSLIVEPVLSPLHIESVFAPFIVDPAPATLFFEQPEIFIENEYLKVSANQDGTLNIIDKDTLNEYVGIGYLDDCGDKGEGWNHFYPATDKVFLSKDCARDVDISYSSNNIKHKIDITYKFDIPKSLDSERAKRVEEMTTLNVRNTYTLMNDKKYLECHTEIENTAIEHRIRVLCPTDTNTDHVLCDSAFDIVKRQIKLVDTTNWKETAREDNPIKNFVGVADEKRGFAIITRGLCEGCCLDDEKRTLGVTLYRSFVETLFANSTNDSKHLATLSFDYAFAVIGSEKEITNCVEQYKLPVKAFTHWIGREPAQPAINQSQMFIKTGELSLSSVVLVGDDIEVRVFNPFEVEIINKLKPCFKFSSIEILELSGKVISDTFPTFIAPKKILTVRYKNCSI